MNYQQFNNILNNYNIKSITNNQYTSYTQFYNYLIEENSKYNLTSITNEDEVYLKHFVDSLLGSNIIKDNSSILDIGCGAGFPSIPLAICNPTYKITAIDSVNKKINFVNNAAKLLNLSNINAIHTRIEDLAYNNQYRETFDIVVSRAVAPLNTLIEYAIPFLKINGKFVAYKSINAMEEINIAKNALKELNSEIEDYIDIDFKEINSQRCFIIIKKFNKTAKKYPRIQNKARKQPL